jgi:hypothetical protein
MEMELLPSLTTQIILDVESTASGNGPFPAADMVATRSGVVLKGEAVDAVPFLLPPHPMTVPRKSPKKRIVTNLKTGLVVDFMIDLLGQ